MPDNLIFVGIDFLLPHRKEIHGQFFYVVRRLTESLLVYINSYLAL